MAQCIKCNKDVGGSTGQTICGDCAEEYLNAMTPLDQMAHALVGQDRLAGLTGLQARLEGYKEKSLEELTNLFWERVKRPAK